MSEASVQRWLKDDSFRAAYRSARLNVVERVVGRMQALTSEAVETPRRNLTCGNPAVQTRAAVSIFD